MRFPAVVCGNEPAQKLILRINFSDMNTRMVLALFFMSSVIGALAQSAWEVQLMTGNSGDGLNDVYFIDELAGWAVGDEGLVLRTTDGGETWDNINSGFSQNFYSVHFVNADRGWIAGYNNGSPLDGVLLRTTNGGQSWTPQLSGMDNHYEVVHFIDEDTGWVAGNFTSQPIPYVITRTTNQGGNWFPSFFDEQVGPYTELFFYDFDHGWAATIDGIYFAGQGGTELSLQHTLNPNFGPANSLFFIDEDTGWVAGGSWADQCMHRIFFGKTTNGGADWDILESSNDSSYYYTDVFFTTPETGWMVTSSFCNPPIGKIFFSEDGGDTWSEVYSTTDFELSALHFTSPQTGWAVGSHGTILKFSCPPAEETLDMEICEGDTATVGSSVYTETGLYRDTLEGAFRCDSIVELNLVVHPPVDTSFAASICEGESVMVGGSVYTASGIYRDTLASIFGCDSIVELDLVVHPPEDTNLVANICEGESFTVGGTVYETQGLYTETLQSAAGCDSLVELDLTVHPVYDTTLEVTLCPDEPAPADQFLMTAAGCDSIIRYDITAVTGTAVGGAGDTRCDPNAQLSAQPVAAPLTGTWQALNTTAIINTPDVAQTDVFELPPGENRFVWSISHPECPDFSQDTVVLVYDDALIEAEDDTYTATPGGMLTENVLGNDQFGAFSDLEVSIVEEQNESIGTLSLTADGMLTYSYPEPTNVLFRGFRYRVVNTHCPTIADVADVRIQLQDTDAMAGSTEEEQVSVVFTPNGDGLNDVFIIPELADNPGDYPRNSLSVINRWGDVVFEASPYNNDWDGTHYRTGEPLPPGTYFYIARLSVVEGVVKRERVTLVR